MTDPAARFRTDLAAAAGIIPDRLAVAVSGGPDSLALLLLAAEAFPGAATAVTVDHGLRKEAAAEAQAVAAICAARHIPHTTLRVSVERHGDGVQAAARRARYAALAAHAGASALPLVLTAHHADDQAETVLMRLARGAGVGGLSGIRTRRPLAPGTVLARPLLRWRKSELAAIVAAADLVPSVDPSNHDVRFDRTGARALLAATDWLAPERIAASASHLAAAEEALAWTAAEAARSRISEHDAGLRLDPAGLPAELRRRLVQIALERLDVAPDGPSLDRLIGALAAGRRVSIGHLTAIPGTCWRFSTAPARRSL